MAAPNRSALLTKMHKVLKKHYTPVPTPERPVLEQLLYACCLENAHYEAADKAYAAVSTTFFDWNEVRVSTVKELAEVMHALPDPQAAAARLKRTLQSVFEASYTFELEGLKKQNLGQAQQKLAKYEGVTPFAVAYVTQASLGGHSIPLDQGLLEVFAVLSLATPQDKASHSVPGLERAIAKNKGVEFGSLAHQLGADMFSGPYSPALHKILLEIAPEAKEHLPKRPTKTAKPAEAEKPKEAAEKSAAKPVAGEKGAKPGKPSEPAKATAKAKTAPTSKKTEPGKKGRDGAAKEPSDRKSGEKKKSAAAGLAKRKPR